MEWKTGYPEMVGWCDCLVNGKEMRLRHWVCGMSGRHEWVQANGIYISKDTEVLWRGRVEEIDYC